MPKRILSAKELDQRRRQREFDEYDAAVAREQAEIAARLAGKPDRKTLAAQSPASYSWGGEYDDPPPGQKRRRKRDFFGPEAIVAPPPPTNYIVSGLFAASSLNLLVGDPGHKKSILAIDLGISVAMGKPWLGQQVKQTSVVLVEEEFGFLMLWRRLHAAFLGHSATVATPFHFINMGNYDFRSLEEASDLIEHARSVDARLIIIDSLADVMLGSDENSVLSMQPVLRNLRTVALDCSAAVVIVHHNNKSGAFRGSTSLSAGVNHMLSVYSPPGQNLIRLSTLKSHDLEPITLHARAHFEPDRFYLTPTDEEPLPPSNHTGVSYAIIQYLTDHGPSLFTQLVEALPLTTPGNIRQCVRELVEGKRIYRVDDGAKGKKATYAISTPKYQGP